MSNSVLSEQFKSLVKGLNKILTGRDDEDVEIEGVSKPTISKYLKSSISMISSKADKEYVDRVIGDITGAPTKVYPSLSAANSDLVNIPVRTPVLVASTANGGIWYKDNDSSASLTKSEHDPVVVSNALIESAISPVRSKVGELQVVSLPPESGYVWGLKDPVSGRVPVRVATDGIMEIDSLKLATPLPYSPEYLNPESGYVWGLKDPVSGRVPVRVATDGTMEIDSLTLNRDTVTAKSLTQELSDQIMGYPEQVDHDYFDNWRAKKSQVGLKTQGSGYWNQLPSVKTKSIFGVNSSGTSISIRKTKGLPIIGKSYKGEWGADSVRSIREVGVISGPSTSYPSGTPVEGDYYSYVNGSALPSTGAYVGMNIGDLLVYDGQNWVVQKAPADVSSRDQNGVYWRVMVDTTFAGVEYKEGDCILYVTRQTGGGGNQYERFIKVDASAGDLVYRGVVSSMPSSYYEGDVFEAGVDFDGYTKGDYLLVSSGSIVRVQNDQEAVIPNGGSFYFGCLNTSEFEVRRTDKSGQSVGFMANFYVQSNSIKSTNKLLLLSDSMFGSGGSGSLVLQYSGRSGEVKSFGGSQSNQVMGMMEYFIRSGDKYKGHTFIVWHGQNNQPSNLANASLIRECSLKMRQLVGAINPKVIFLSVLGQRNLSWVQSEGRYVCNQHEGFRNKQGHLWELKEWYDDVFPNRHISPYEILLAAADDTLDPTFPNMTEKQVADQYGILPYSFFGNTNGEWGDVSNLNYKGIWSASGLPASTGNQFDYYLRTSGGGASDFLIVYINGAWVQKTMDITHLSSRGSEALAKGIVKFLEDNHL